VAGRDVGQPLIVGRPQAVRLLHVSLRTFDRLEAEGVVSPLTPRRGSKGASYDAVAVVGAFLAHQERKLTGSAENPRDRRDKAVAEWTELRIARERRLLLPRADVIEDGHRYIAAVQARLRAVAPRLRQEAGVDDAVAGQVEKLIEEAIQEMAGWRTSLELLAAEDDAA